MGWRSLGVGSVVGMLGCSPVVGSPADDDTTSASDPTSVATSVTLGSSSPDTSVGTTESTTVATTDPSTTTEVGEDVGTDESGCYGFICPPDGGDGDPECDVWAQDCPRGEKCMPWANDGGNAWNATRCSPLAAVPSQVGDPCLVGDSATSGVDSCDLSLVCLFADPVTDAGVCVENCMGSEANPSCADPAKLCEIAFEGVIISCLQTCDPLAQDCPSHAACYPGNLGFVCGDPLEPAIAIGEPCEREWDCEAGTFCASADILPLCGGAACCTGYCDTTLPEPCGPERVCNPIYADGSAPGYCTAP